MDSPNADPVWREKIADVLHSWEPGWYTAGHEG